MRAGVRTAEGAADAGGADYAARPKISDAAIEHMAQGILVLDREQRVVSWNRRYETLAGFPPGLVRIGMTLAELIRFDLYRQGLDKDEVERRLAQRLAAAKGNDATVDLRLIEHDRVLRAYRQSLPDGGMVVTFTDITADSRLVEALEASEARFAAYARMSTDWLWEQDAELRFTFVSRPPTVDDEVFLGASVGKRRDELDLVIEDEEAWRRHLEDLAARRPFREFGYGRRDADGRLRHIIVSGDPIFARDGTFQGYRGTGTDVTAEREALRRAREAEAAAASAHARLVTALETITQGFALFDAEDRLVTCNRQYLERTTLDIEQLVGIRFENMLLGVVATGWRGYLPGAETTSAPEEWIAWRLAMRRNPPPQPFVYKGADGRWWMISEKRTADGGTVALRVNATELKEAELKLRLARDEAQAASRAKNVFLASMSHELRTPLNAIIGFSEILRSEMFGALGAERYRGYAENIFASATYLMDLIRDVLDMAKIEAGRLEVSVEPIDIAGEIDSCLTMIGDSARAAGLVVERRIPGDLPLLHADSRAVRQILLNLLSNAIKFTPAGGGIEISAAADGGAGRIAVADTGIGIPAADLPRLGRPFEQVDNVLHRKRPGSGLGLALSRSLAELMGGSLSVESVEGEGTTVTLSLPVAATA